MVRAGPSADFSKVTFASWQNQNRWLSIQATLPRSVHEIDHALYVMIAGEPKGRAVSSPATAVLTELDAVY